MQRVSRIPSRLAYYRDADLYYAIEKYFDQQVGYKETWSKLREQPAWRAYVAEQVASS